MSSKPIVLITGASGMIGRALVRRLAGRGLSLRLAVRDKNSMLRAIPEFNCFEVIPQIVEYDLAALDAENNKALVQGCTSVVHMAGLVHQARAPVEQYDVLNRRATVLLYEAAAAASVEKFVFLSTIAVYGSTFVNVSEEAAMKEPPGGYALSKLDCEKYIFERDQIPVAAVLRPALVFGPGDRGNMLSLIRQIVKRRYFHIGAAAARKSLICADELAEVIDLCLEKCLPGYHIMNVAGGSYSMHEIATAIAAAASVSQPIPTVPKSLVTVGSTLLSILGDRSPLSPERLGKLTASTSVSCAKLEKTTGFQSHTALVDALSSELSWARSAGKI